MSKEKLRKCVYGNEKNPKYRKIISLQNTNEFESCQLSRELWRISVWLCTCMSQVYVTQVLSSH